MDATKLSGCSAKLNPQDAFACGLGGVLQVLHWSGFNKSSESELKQFRMLRLYPEARNGVGIP